MSLRESDEHVERFSDEELRACVEELAEDFDRSEFELWNNAQREAAKYIDSEFPFEWKLSPLETADA